MFIFYSLIGLAVGSFLNVCIDRLPLGQSILHPPSHCPNCGKPIAVRDLIPVLSYALLGGRCRYCSASIPVRVPLVELGTGVIFGLLWLWLGPGVKLAVASLYAAILIVITVIDLEHRLVLNKVIYPAILLFPFAAFAYGVGVKEILLGGLAGFALMLVPYLASKGGLGAGDVKLAAFIGLANGFPNVLVAIFAASIFGGLTASFLLLTGLRGRKDPIPFAPFICLGGAVAFVWGEKILYWYIGLL
ncbi:MAG: pulO [Dehalococcoidia bacterium]|nr:pulO [Dehalococcoidia bacterium]